MGSTPSAEAAEHRVRQLWPEGIRHEIDGVDQSPGCTTG
jgi:hypothetical protein